MTKETKASGEAISYAYDAAGNRTTVTTPQGTTTYTYEALNRLATVMDTTGATTYTYDAVGNLASTAYPNGVTTTYGYDTLNRLVQMTNTGSAGQISSYTYTLGPAGNRLQVVEAGPATTGRMVSYAYDAVYHLTQEAIDEPGTANDQTITYSYDAVGNRTQLNRNGTVTTSTYDANDRLLTETTGSSTVTSTYDANGNLTRRTVGTTRGDGSRRRRCRCQLHRYLYANADPINNRDPSGRLTLAETSTVLSIISVLSLMGSIVADLAGYEQTAYYLRVISIVTLVVSVGTGLAAAGVELGLFRGSFAWQLANLSEKSTVEEVVRVVAYAARNFNRGQFIALLRLIVTESPGGKALLERLLQSGYSRVLLADALENTGPTFLEEVQEDVYIGLGRFPPTFR